MTGKIFAPTSLLNTLRSWPERRNGIAVYIFGSWLRDSPSASDVDVLLVYPDGNLDSAHTLAETIRNLPTKETYDVLALSTVEEGELSFVASESAMRVWPASLYSDMELAGHA
jgi:predicted nucleotidyltransferase